MAKTEACPECGDLFDPRGIKLHRKVRHGVQSAGGGFYSESSKPPTTPAPSGTEQVACELTEEAPKAPKSDDGWGFF